MYVDSNGILQPRSLSRIICLRNKREINCVVSVEFDAVTFLDEVKRFSCPPAVKSVQNSFAVGGETVETFGNVKCHVVAHERGICIILESQGLCCFGDNAFCSFVSQAARVPTCYRARVAVVLNNPTIFFQESIAVVRFLTIGNHVVDNVLNAFEM